MKSEIPIPGALLAAALSVALTLAACGGGDEDSRKFTQRVYGEANPGTPLVGARIEIVGARGQNVTASCDPTDANGTSVVELPPSGVPNFRVFRRLGESFALTVDGSKVLFAQVQATPLPARPQSLGARAPFSVIFRNTASVLFPHQTYSATHTVLGTFGTF